jgi:hypothetical protein
VPHPTKEFVAGHHAASLLHEKSQDPAADGTKLIEGAVYLQPSRPSVEGQTRSADNVGGTGYQGRLNQLDKLGHLKRACKGGVYMIWDWLISPCQGQQRGFEPALEPGYAAGTA